MKNKIASTMMILGSVLIIAALSLFIYNNHEQEQAAEAAAEVMPQLAEVIQQNAETAAEETSDAHLPPSLREEQEKAKEMPTAHISGYDYIGFVTIPSQDLQLPVMADWTKQKLKKAPCHYSGSFYTDDLVLMAHNFNRHFKRIAKLTPGDAVSFTDAEGKTHYYEVVALEVLDPYDVELMTAGEYDLTLFTCTYGGRTRMTVRCDEIDSYSQKNQ